MFSGQFSISYKTEQRLPNLPFPRLARKILGPRYELSIAAVGRRRMSTLNRRYRGLRQATDILSFPLGKFSGEIIICPAVAKKKALKCYGPYRHYLGFLFIHGLLHLKGRHHGAIMEREERTWCQKFSISLPE